MSASSNTFLLDKPKRHIFITGCSTGIGSACAKRLAKAGFGVFAGVRTDADAQSIQSQSNGIRAVMIDVAVKESIHHAANHIAQAVADDGLYALINNAGICTVGPIECISLEDWRYQFEVNFFGPLAVTQAMLPLLRAYRSNGKKNWARIININSITGLVSTPAFGAYSTSKHALRALDDCLRLELVAHKIRVCTIIPGTIQTEIWRKEMEGMKAVSNDPLARRLYGKLIDQVSKNVFNRVENAMPPDGVARVIERALQSQKPRQRYLIEKNAVLGSWARRLMPERLFYFLTGKTLGVPR